MVRKCFFINAGFVIFAMGPLVLTSSVRRRSRSPNILALVLVSGSSLSVFAFCNWSIALSI